MLGNSLSQTDRILSIKGYLKRYRITRAIGKGIKSFLREYHTKEYILSEKRKDYFFLDNSHDYEDMCIVLAGYKSDLWDDVFDRIKAYVYENMDICVCSSGKKDERLLEICKQNGWSYLATKKNQISDVQNIAIDLHKAARYIFKLDEDIFVTKYFFENLKRRMTISNPTYYEIGFVCPLINVNGYSYVRVLEKLNLIGHWEKYFNECMHTDGIHHHMDIWKNGNAAKFMWGEDCPELNDLDAVAEKFNSEADSYSLCNTRFSIGAILFTRKAWEEMGHFPVDNSIGLGADEEAICHWCMFSARAIVVDENTIVGHLSYGPQNAVMLEYYKNNRHKFRYSGN